MNQINPAESNAATPANQPEIQALEAGTLPGSERQPSLRHPKFEIDLYSDEQLAGILNAPIAARETLSEWPLSHVEKVTTTSGAAYIYKAQKPPSIEAEFYAKASSSVIPRFDVLEESPGQSSALLEVIPGVPASSLKLSENEVVALGRELVAEIRKVTGDIPYYADIGTATGWNLLVKRMVSGLRELVQRGAFKSVDNAMIDKLDTVAKSPEMLAAMTTDPGLIHADLKGANVMLDGERFKIIDWQYPRFGPSEFDLARFIESFGYDPARTVDQSIAKAIYLVRIEWFTDCALRWIPGGTGFYDREIARLAKIIDGIGTAG